MWFRLLARRTVVDARLCFLMLLASIAFLNGCAAGDDGEEDDEDVAVSDEELRYDGNSYKYIYSGPLPNLRDARVTVSLSAHTARVSGCLPASFSGRDVNYIAGP